MKKIFILSVFILVIIVGVVIYVVKNRTQNINPTLINQVNYLCEGNKTIEANFYKGEIKPVESGQPPIPSGSVKLVLSDGRKLDLKQTLSADGARYANNDESFVFWIRGNGAQVLENGEESSYLGCIVLKENQGDLPNSYVDGEIGFFGKISKRLSFRNIL